MPVVKTDSEIPERSAAHKGILYLIGVAAFVVLWLVSWGSDMLVYTSEQVYPVLIPIVASILVAVLFRRISRVYPGAAEVFGYVVSSMLALALAVLALVTLSENQSWLQIGIATSVIALIYPTVAIGFSRGIEVFMTKLGLHDDDVSTLEHIDTLYSRKKSIEQVEVEAIPDVAPEPVVEEVVVIVPKRKPAARKPAVKKIADSVTSEEK